MRQVLAIVLLAVFFITASPKALSAPSDSLSLAAQYYYSHHDYPQALGLWSEVLKKDPINTMALLRVCELKILTEGREACRELMLSNLEGPNLRTTESRKFLIERFRDLQKLFLTDEGQTSYLQAVSWVKLKELPRALASFERASQLEKGNASVLREKAKTEKLMGQWDSYLQTCQLAYENDPFDPAVVEETMEVGSYLGNYEKVVSIQHRSVSTNTIRSQIAYAFALVQMGNVTDALPLLQTIAGQGKITSLHPIVWYSLGKLFSQKRDGHSEAVTYLQRFLSSTARPENLLIEGWDPYRSTDKVDEAKKLLASLAS